MAHTTDDLRIDNIKPLLPPAILIEEQPISDAQAELVARSRGAIADIVHGRDDRLAVVIGPCSVHDPAAALDYAGRLKEKADALSGQLCVIMRTYFEKPRTTVGWKGLINDPGLDGSFDINRGLRTARKFLCDVLDLGLPPGTEFLDPISPQFVADLICWGAIGARTTESQVHRELASGLSMPVGFKNGTRGSVQIAVDALGAVVHPHHFLSVTKQGLSAIVATAGNPDCHLILRGGSEGPNFDAAAVEAAAATLEKGGVNPRVMIDCSHANSGKNHEKQPDVAGVVADQVAGGDARIVGVMLESFIEPGNQKAKPGEPLVYGKSITDKCMGWDTSAGVLVRLAEAVEKRRAG